MIDLDKKYNLSGILNKKIIIPLMGHKSPFPAMNDTVLIGALIIIALTIASAISYQLYYQYKYEKDVLEGKDSEKRKISWIKRFLPFLLYCIFHSLFDFVYEELCVTFEQSVSGLNFKNKYVWTIYGILLGMMVLDQIVELFEIHLLNDKLSLLNKQGKTKSQNSLTEKLTENKKQSKLSVFLEYLTKFIILIILSLALIVISIGLNELPKCLMKPIETTIDGQNIVFFSNKDNIFILSLAPILLIAIIYKFIIPSLEELTKASKNNEILSKTDRLKNCAGKFKKEATSLEGLKTISLSVMIAISVNLSICSVNTLQSINLSSASVLIPIIQLLIVSMAFVGFQVMQFCNEEEGPDNNLENHQQHTHTCCRH
jgi:hypothetical protein